jgi:hypothetical protein
MDLAHTWGSGYPYKHQRLIASGKGYAGKTKRIDSALLEKKEGEERKGRGG